MNKTKGISLVALVITIIVLIILTGAVILSVTDNNIFNRAKESVSGWNKATAQEQLQQVVLDLRLSNSLDQNNLQNKLKENNANWGSVTGDSTNGYSVNYNDGESAFSFAISSTGNISYVEPIQTPESSRLYLASTDDMENKTITKIRIPNSNSLTKADLDELEYNDGTSNSFNITITSDGNKRIEIFAMATNSLVTTNYIQIFNHDDVITSAKDVYAYLTEPTALFSRGWNSLNMISEHEPDMNSITSESTDILDLNNITATFSSNDLTLAEKQAFDKVIELYGY